MFDINSILTQALAAAVAEAMLPLQQEYANKMGEMATRIATLETRLLALENNPAQGVDTTLDTTLETRVAALEKHTAVLDQHGGILEALVDQEWFWEKVGRFVGEAVARHEDDAPHIGHLCIDQKIETAVENHEEGMSHYDEDDIDTKIDAAIEQHEENRTHGDDDDIEQIVQKLLNSASISISV
jgi:hypothetical protein